MGSMHIYTEETDRIAEAIVAYATERIRLDPPPLDAPRSPAELAERVGRTITEEGLGGPDALRVWVEELAPANISTDHPLFLAFVPSAPTKSAVLFDLAVSASSTVGATWMEASGGVYAENEALRWLADLAGMPDGSGGCFVSGGSAGNLSGLVTARHTVERRRAGEGLERPARWRVAAVDEAHSSIRSAARIMDADVLAVAHDERGRLTGPNLDAALAEAVGRRRPMLVDITRSLPLDAETRHAYSGQKLVDGFTALALLVEASPLGMMMGNVYFRVARPGIPTHLFTDAPRAHAWLKGYLE
jgi:hypothetical protein